MRIKLQEYYDRMEQAVTAILTNADVRDYLKKVALFRKYSFGNTLFIVLQRPSAARVAGLTTWNRLGRRVKKGEKGITIFAPSSAGKRSKSRRIENTTSRRKATRLPGQAVPV